MSRPVTAIVGAAETTRLGRIDDRSQLDLHADAALNALADAGLTLRDVDGFATAHECAADVAAYLGIAPGWVDGTSVGGCSFMSHVRHAAAAIAAGHCKTVLITHGESGRSRIGWHFSWSPAGLIGQYDAPFGMSGAPSQFGTPLLRYMKEFGVSIEDLASIAVIQREWAALNPRANQRQPISIADVLGSSMIAYPLTKLMCCLVTDGGGALVLTSAERAKDFPRPPVYVLGTGEAVETYTTGIAAVRDPIRPSVIPRSGAAAFKEARLAPADVDHLMVYDATVHSVAAGLEGLGFVKYGEAPAFIAARNTAPGGSLPLNTSGGGLSYAHSGMYGMYALQECVRQLRGVAPAQVPGCEISMAHGFGGFFSACATVILGNQF